MTTASGGPPDRDPQLVCSAEPTTLSEAVTLVAALRGAHDSGLLTALWRWQPCNADEVATRAHLGRRSVEVTLAALARGGLTVHDEDGWKLTSPPEAWEALLAVETDLHRFLETGQEPAPSSRESATAPLVAPTHIREDGER